MANQQGNTVNSSLSNLSHHKERIKSSDVTKHLSSSYDMDNVFHTEFPLPDLPRMHLPTQFTTDESIYTPSQRITSSRKNGSVYTAYRTATTAGPVFRNSESTQKALRDLEQRRYKERERKRFGMLFMTLLTVAWSVYYIAIADNSAVFEDSRPESLSITVSSNGTETFSSEFQPGEAAVGDGAIGEGENEDVEEEDMPEEEIIEEGKEFLLPYQYFADLSTQFRPSDLNFFFHIPRSGGQTIKDIAGKCLGKTLASEVGVREGHGQDPTLQVMEYNEAKYVNVDTTSIEGLIRAAELGLASSNLADMITSSYFAEVNMLFDLHHKGRAFTIMRDPLERATSMYYYRTQGETPEIDPSISLEDYAQGNGIENNWVTRFLTGQMEGELTKEHLEQAKEILKRKFVVGFLDDYETIFRLMNYFSWSFDEDETIQMKQEDCIQDLFKDGANPNPVTYEMPTKGSQAYALIKWQTQFDMKLFDYAKELFDSQTKQFGTKERRKELKKRKKNEGKL